MVGLARILYQKGFHITGSDMKASPNSDSLEQSGIKVFIGHSKKNIPNSNNLMIVRSSAINENNSEYKEAVDRKLHCVLRGEMLAAIAQLYERVVAVAGSHGKTSVTAMLSHILINSGKNPGYMIGGRVNGLRFSADAGDSNIFITESDESDGTQIHLHPKILAVTNIEDDHSWTLGGKNVLWKNFLTIAENSEKIIYGQTENTENLFSSHKNRVPVNYTKKLRIKKHFPLWGDFQLENALIAANSALEFDLPLKKSFEILKSFSGVERRMQIKYSSDNLVLIEDYAHHPTELKAAMQTIRKNYTDFALKIIFQPHRFARLAKYIDDFASTLQNADSIIITPVFAAWTETGEIKGNSLAEKIGRKAMYLDDNWKTIAEKALQNSSDKEIIAVIGAGDIEKIIPPLLSKINSKKGDQSQ